MNIAYLSTFYPFRGGIAQFNVSVLRELEKSGHNTSAFTFKVQYPGFLFPGETQMVQDDDIVDEIESQRILNSAIPFNWPVAASKIKKFNPDLLIMKYWMSYFGPSLGYVAGRMSPNTKVLTILDNVIPHEKKFFDNAFTKYFLNKNHGFIAMSEKVKTDLLSFLPDAKVKLLPHPLYDHFGDIQDKTESRKKLGISEDKKTILFFGFIRDYKGLDILIDTFGLLDDSYQLVIAGEVYGSFDKYDNQIEKLSNKQNVHKHVKYISDKEVRDYFSAADVCVLPYKSATQSGITGISYHFETPMIATDVGGLAEIIHHDKTGLIVEKLDANLISKVIKQYFESEKSVEFKKNIKLLKEKLSWAIFTADLMEFVDSL
jgi:glycosyltransferase involved in cell wall biosynthesis